MFVYRTLRKATLALRSIQTALLGASFVVSDYALNTAERAREAAHESLDKYVESGYAKANYLADAAEALANKRDDAYEAAAVRAQDAYEAAAVRAQDAEERRNLIELEVL